VYDQNSVVAKLVALLFRVWDAPSSDLSLETGNADKLFVPPSVPSRKYECFTSSYVTTAFFPVLFSSLFNYSLIITPITVSPLSLIKHTRDK
jgi:hypothetical protein